jgi:hypothetical protein
LQRVHFPTTVELGQLSCLSGRQTRKSLFVCKPTNIVLNNTCVKEDNNTGNQKIFITKQRKYR